MSVNVCSPMQLHQFWTSSLLLPIQLAAEALVVAVLLAQGLCLISPSWQDHPADETFLNVSAGDSASAATAGPARGSFRKEAAHQGHCRSAPAASQGACRPGQQATPNSPSSTSQVVSCFLCTPLCSWTGMTRYSCICLHCEEGCTL